MLPTRWNNPFDKPTETISWENDDYTFQANCCFPAARHNFLPYYEVFIIGTTGTENSTVAVGVGEAGVSGKGILPGWKSGSYGYHADDGFVYCESGEGKAYGPTYTTGDVVGCGITINNELYFTKNGKSLGIVCTLNRPKLFPVVGLDNASISSNFGNQPFMYNPFTNSPAVTVRQLDPCLSAMIDTTVMNIMSFLTPNLLANFGRVCKEYYKLSKGNQIWKPLVTREWQTVSPDVPINSYYEFFKQRKANLAGGGQKILIENCLKWEFQCPATLDKLSRTPNPEVDHCSVCKKDVYLVHNMSELKEKVAAKQCVAIDFMDTEKTKRDWARKQPRIMGRMRVVR